MKQRDPILYYEFVDSKGNKKPLLFEKPQKVISTNRVEEVIPCLQLIQEAVKDGYYAAGFLSYESAVAFDAAFMVKARTTMPLLWFGIFSEPQYQALSSKGSYTLTKWKPSVTRKEYQAAIKSIKQSIRIGDTYQTNYTIRLQSCFEGDDIAFFERLKEAQSSNYCAYIHTGEHSVLSASPELFFHLKEDTLTTRPMKGTVKRGKSFEEDNTNANWLFHSEKNRAENVMIVDLLRNDLGTIAKPGTVNVEKLFEIEAYPTVHQMTSTITCKVPENVSILDILKALFPCGSITGAPKISTMKIITGLETSPREVYCGAIGYFTPQREATFNVPIRTVILEAKSGKATYGVGGGITWDSTIRGEYEEILAKASLLQVERPQFQLLESLLLENGIYFLLEEHLNRLQNSVKYFKFPFNLTQLKTSLKDLSKVHGKGVFKVRILLSNTGKITIEEQPILQTKTPILAMLADKPIDYSNPFFYHKTTYKELYSKFLSNKPDNISNVLLWNEKNELTEFTNGNIVMEIEGVLWTPPVKCGLLAGTFREVLLKNGEIQEKVLTKADLKRCSKIWFINSVRRWLEIEIMENPKDKGEKNGEIIF